MNQQILNEIRTLKRQILPNEKVILFGSQARGDARPDSDWDLLVLLDKNGRRNWDDFDNYAYPFTEIGWDYGVAINPILYTQEEWDKGKIFPFYKNVMREGIEINCRSSYSKFYRTAANRLYYACFYAAIALLVNDSYETHTHSGVKTVLGLHYVRGDKIEKSFGKMYQQLFNLRQDGDYEDWFEIEEKDILPLLEPAEKFIETIENLVNKN